MPAIQGTFSEEFSGRKLDDEIGKPARVIRDARTGFKPQVLETESFEQKVVFSYGKHLFEADMKRILPLCKALDFEPYRDREMSMNDEGYIDHRLEIDVHFTAISDSYIPKLELPMSYFYDEEHIWPSEKLYRFLMKTYFEKNRKTKDWITPYGRSALYG